MNYFDRGNGQSGDAQTTDFVWDGDSAKVALPPSFNISTVQFERLGPDLKAIAASGESMLVTNYFAAENVPEIAFANNVVLPADIVAKLAGPIVSNQYAQATDPALAEPIGSVETAEGVVEVVRADGTRETLTTGDAVYQGDELITGAGAAVGVVFADETTFALGEDGRMILDEMVYDPGGEDGALGMTLLSGAMTFVSGAVAKVNPDAMQITTPVATIGIRGTAGILKTDGVSAGAALIGESDGSVGEISVTAPNGDTITINVANGMVTASGNGLSDVVIGTTEDMLALGGNGLTVMAAAGMVSEEIASAAQQAQDKIDQQVNAEGEGEVELNSAEGETLAFLESFSDTAQQTQFNIINFFKKTQIEIDIAVGRKITQRVEEFNEFDTAESILAEAILAANSAAEAATAAETKINSATNETSVSSQLSAIGVTDTTAVMNVVYAGFDSFGAALAVSASASSIAELATAALYTTGEGITGAELEEIALEIQASANAALLAAQKVDVIVDAIIASAESMLNDIIANYQTIEVDPDYAGASLDAALQKYAATKDDDNIDAWLSTQGYDYSLNDVDTFLDDVSTSVSSASSVISNLQSTKGDASFLSGFVDVLSSASTLITSADTTTANAEQALTDDVYTDVIGFASDAQTAGLAFEETLQTFVDGALSTYKTAHADSINARVADTAASAEISNNSQRTELGSTTATFKATSNTGEAAKHYLDGTSATNKTNSETTATNASTAYDTARTNLETKISELQKDSADILNAKTDPDLTNVDTSDDVAVDIPDPDDSTILLKPLEKWAAAEATFEVRGDRVTESLTNVRIYSIEELETAQETFIDTLDLALNALEGTFSIIEENLVGDAPSSLTTAISQMTTIDTAITDLAASVDGSGLFNGTSEMDDAAKAQFVTDIQDLLNLITDLETQLGTVSTDLTDPNGTNDVAKGYADSLLTALSAVKTGVNNTVAPLNTAVDPANTFDLTASTALDGNSTTILSNTIGNYNAAITAIDTALTDVTDALQALSDAHSSNTTLAQNAQDVSSQAQNAKTINGFAGDLTELWEGVFDVAENGELAVDGVTRIENGRVHAKADFEAAETIYDQYIADETGARNALVTALQDFKAASTAKYQADKQLAYDKAYLDVGETLAIEQAELVLYNQEVALEDAIQEAIDLIEQASALVDSAKANSTDTSVTQSVLNEFENPTDAAANDLIAQAAAILAKGQAAVTSALQFNSAPADFALAQVKNEIYDFDNRLTALQNKLTSLQKVVDTGGTFDELSNSATAYNNLATAEEALAALQPGDAGYSDAQDDVTAAETAATNADNAVNVAKNAEATDRVNTAVEVATNAVTQANEIKTDTEQVINLADVTSLDSELSAQLVDMQTAIDNAVAQKAIVDAAKVDHTNATTPEQALAAATAAENAANSALFYTFEVEDISKNISSAIVNWATAIITVQLAIAVAAQAAAEAAEANVQTAYDLIDTSSITPANVTQDDVDTLDNIVNNSIIPQEAIVTQQVAIADAAFDAANAALEIAKLGAGNHPEFAIDLQIFADEVGEIRQASSVVDNAAKTANTNLTTAELSQTLVSTMLNVREIREEAEASAQAAADQAAQDAQDALDAEAAAQAAADDLAIAEAEALAAVAAEKAALAETYAAAAQEAAINANQVDADAQYELASQAAQEAQTSAAAAAEAAAGHGSVALAHASAAAESSAQAQISLAIAQTAKDTASNSAAAADAWRAGTATSDVETTKDDVTAVTVTTDLVTLANNNAESAIAAVNTAKTSAISAQVAAASAEASWKSQQASESEAVDRLVQEMANEGLTAPADLATYSNAQIDALDLSGAGTKESVLRIWADALKTAKTATTNAEAAFNTASDGATVANNELTVAETEATAALEAAVAAAAQVADVIAKAAAAAATETLGRLAADLQAESYVSDALDVMTSSNAIISDATTSNDPTDIINAQFDILASLNLIANADLTQANVDAAIAAQTAATNALAIALAAKEAADAAIVEINDIDSNSANGTSPAIEQFYVLKSGLPGTPSIGELDNYNNTHDWVNVGDGGTHVIHVDSIAKYQSVLSNIDLAEKQASQIENAYNALAAKVNESAQALSQIETGFEEANFAAVSEINAKFDEYVERTEGATENAVDAATSAVTAAKSAIDGFVALAGGEADGAGKIIVGGSEDANLTSLVTLLSDAVTDANALSAAVEGWSADGTDPTDQNVTDLLANSQSIIDNLTTALNNLATSTTRVDFDSTTLGQDVDGNGDNVADYATDALTQAQTAMQQARLAALELEDINDNSIDLGGTIEQALTQIEPANNAVTNAQNAAQESGSAALNAGKIDVVLENQAKLAADNAAEAARQADYDAAVAAQQSVAGEAAQARQDADDAKTAYDNALAQQTAATTKAAAAVIAATFAGSVFTDLQAKAATEQANTAAQNALGEDSSTADAQNVASEVAKAKAAWLAAESSADAAEAANTAIDTAVSEAASALAAGESVSQYRQTAETNAKTVSDENAAADASRVLAESAETDAGTAAQRVSDQSDEAVAKRAEYDVSDDVSGYNNQVNAAFVQANEDLNDLQIAVNGSVDGTTTAGVIKEAQNAAEQVDQAAQDVDTNGASADLSDEIADATTARDNAQGFAQTAADELAAINTSYDNAVTARDNAQSVVDDAGTSANDFARAELSAAIETVAQLSSLREQAIQINDEAQAAYQQAVDAVTAIENLDSGVLSLQEARAQAIAAFESEADQSYETALQTSVRAQSIADEISDGTEGVYDLALALAGSLQTTINTWLTDNSADFPSTVADEINTLLDRIDHADNDDDLLYQLDTIKTDATNSVDTSFDAIFNSVTGHLKLAETASTTPPADLAEAQTLAQTAATQAENVEIETTKLEAQRQLIEGLYNDIKAVEESYNQVVAEAQAEKDLADAQAAAEATPTAYDDTITGIDEDTSQVINLFAANGGNADSRQDGSVNDLELIAVGQPANGTVEIIQVGDPDYDVNKPGQIRYTPDPDYNGDDSFTYTMSNGGLAADGVTVVPVKFSTAEVSVTVDPINDTPVALNDFSYIQDEVSPVDVRVLLNDTDVDGDNISIHGVIGDGTGNTLETDNDVDIYELDNTGASHR